MTPEGRVKEVVKRLLKATAAYYHMPVQNGMGSPTLDINGCHRGFYFAVETKAPGGHPTKRQLRTLADMIDAGASVFLIDGPDTDLDQFSKWLLNPEANVIGVAVLAELKAFYETNKESP